MKLEGVGLWFSTLLVIGVLPPILLQAFIGWSLWTMFGLLWLCFSLAYVAYAMVRPFDFKNAPRLRKLLLGHVGIRLDYTYFFLVLFFLIGLPIQGIPALVLPLLLDSGNEWIIYPKTRKATVMRAFVYVFIILEVLWLETKL